MIRSSEQTPPDADEVKQLREKYYNATIIERIDIHPDLARFRIRPDEPIPPFQPGQYVALGLGYWEPRLERTQHEEVPIKRARKLVRRAYSISCPMTDAAGHLLPVNQLDYLEFYITLVRQAGSEDDRPPALTPRLFRLSAGDRIDVESKITGTYTLADIRPDETVLMLGTGTGEAPHNAMVASLLADGHRGRIAIATSLRHRADISYAAEHEMLTRHFRQYRYLPLTTREPENIDHTHPNYVGKQYLQTLFLSGKLAEMADDPLDPANTHVFLCGNPDMIGYVPPGSELPTQPGMLPLLRTAGFRDDPDCRGAGCIRFEKYW